MDLIILAGGQGTRLRKAVPDLPKALAPINRKPFLQILTERLKRFSCFGKIIFALSYRSEQIISFIESQTGLLPFEFSIEFSPLGTGGAVKKAMQQSSTDHVFVLNGDTYLNIDYQDFLKCHLQNKADFTIAYHNSENAKRYGSLKIAPSSQKVLSFSEKRGVKGWINAGVYLFHHCLFQEFAEDAFSLEEVAFPFFVKKRTYGYRCDSLFIDIGTQESFHQAQKLFKSLEEMKI